MDYPLSRADFSDRLRIASAPFEIAPYLEMSGLASGQLLYAALSEPIWTAQVRTAPMLHSEAKRIRALINSMIHDGGSFNMVDPLACYPFKDPGGTKFGNSGATIYSIGSRRMRITGLPAFYKLSLGDRLCWRYGSNPTRRAFHEVSEDVTAYSTGLTPEFEVFPHIQPGSQIGMEVVLRRPWCEMHIVPGSLQVRPDGNREILEFTAMEITH